MIIVNPKRDSNPRGKASWYPYYAGFSDSFAQNLLGSIGDTPGAVILDPWNGSGTTCVNAANLGYVTYGYDLNPVMVIAAKARQVNILDKPSLTPLAYDIISKALNSSYRSPKSDPLNAWFRFSTTSRFRHVEKAIQTLLINSEKYQSLIERADYGFVSPIACFFYTALFRTVRSLLKTFIGSNPTWTKKPKTLREKLRYSASDVTDEFMSQVNLMLSVMEEDVYGPAALEGKITVNVGSSEKIPLEDGSADFILTSPPYCTRIDYAVATAPELAILGYAETTSFDRLRRGLIGTATVPKTVPDVSQEWGMTCLSFLERLYEHPSKASKSYYYKNHLQYFQSLSISIGELSRVLKTNGQCVLVLQDSFYKELHNDLSRIAVEMGKSAGLILDQRVNFPTRQTMANVNQAARIYRDSATVTESVLCFKK